MNRPKWYFQSVFYSIHPQVFQDSNGDGIGDIEGIISRFEYLQSLGIDALLINPIYVSSFKDAGYDTVDYKNIAPRYGNLETYDRLIREAHRRGMRILGDLVFVATSDEHPWFRKSQKMEKNRCSKWYVWSQDPKSVRTDRGMWIINEAARYEAYYVGWLPHQPWLNFGFPGLSERHGNRYGDPDLKALRDELKGIVRFWLDREVDGFRFDSAEICIPTNKMHENTIRFWREIREVLDSYSDKFSIAEGGEGQPIEDILQCRFHNCFTIPQFKRLFPCGYEGLFPTPFDKDPESSPRKQFFSPRGGDIAWFVEEYLKLYNEVTKYGGVLSMITGTHDVPRISEVCQKDEIIKCYFAMLLTYPTVPFIYYGSEIGMRYRDNIPSKEGSGSRAGSRTPMQWNRKRNGGFSAAETSKLYFPLNDDYLTRNVETQEDSPKSILTAVKKLTRLRKLNPCLGPFGCIRHLHLKKGDNTYIYSRYDNGGAFVIALNPSDNRHNVTVRLTGKEEELRNAKYLVPKVYSHSVRKVNVGKELYFEFPANFFAIYRAV